MTLMNFMIVGTALCVLLAASLTLVAKGRTIHLTVYVVAGATLCLLSSLVANYNTVSAPPSVHVLATIGIPIALFLCIITGGLASISKCDKNEQK